VVQRLSQALGESLALVAPESSSIELENLLGDLGLMNVFLQVLRQLLLVNKVVILLLEELSKRH